MSTEIHTAHPSLYPDSKAIIRRHSAEAMNIVVKHPQSVLRGVAGVTFSRADFLAAVEKEAGGTFIADADLPEVTEFSAERISIEDMTYDREADADNLHRAALRYLAAAKYLRANPPVDEAKVEALADLLEDAVLNDNSEGTYFPAARRLLATGRIDIKEQS